MKKKLLLFALPALMVLSSCTYMQSANVQPKGNPFKEDASAHSEVFGDAKEEFNLGKQSPFKRSSEDDFVEPKIGVQYGEKYDISETATPDWRIAVRFIAAVGSLDVDAEWTRTVYKTDGTKLGSTETRPTTKAYEVLNGGYGVGTIRADMQSPDNDTLDLAPFNYFVAYTVYDIPFESFDDYYIVAHLTLTDPYGSHAPAYSKAMAARIGGGATAKFDKDKTGFFLAGVINGQVGTTIDQNYDIKGDNAAAFADYFVDGDRIMIIQKEASTFKVWNGANLESGNAEASNVNEMIEIGVEARYAFYLNTKNEIWHDAHTEYREYYVRGPATNGTWGNLEDDTYRLHTDPTNYAFIRVTLKAGEFKLTYKDSWDNAKGYGDRVDNPVGSAIDGTHITGSDNFECLIPGVYDIYMNGSYKIHIVFIREIPAA